MRAAISTGLNTSTDLWPQEMFTFSEIQEACGAPPQLAALVKGNVSEKRTPISLKITVGTYIRIGTKDNRLHIPDEDFYSPRQVHVVLNNSVLEQAVNNGKHRKGNWGESFLAVNSQGLCARESVSWCISWHFLWKLKAKILKGDG